MNGQAALSRNLAGTDASNDLCMRSHFSTVHYALDKCKCLMHRDARYRLAMDSPNERLKFAREQAGYKTVEEAAKALNVNVNTYRQHENDTRNLGGIPRERAPQYARKYRVSLEWLLTGIGEMRGTPKGELINFIDKLSEDQMPQAKAFLEFLASKNDRE